MYIPWVFNMQHVVSLFSCLCIPGLLISDCKIIIQSKIFYPFNNFYVHTTFAAHLSLRMQVKYSNDYATVNRERCPHSTVVVIHSLLTLKPLTSQLTHFREIFRKSSHHVNTNKGRVVKQSGNDVEVVDLKRFCFNPICAYFCNTV